jgi:hypothetical protein
LFIYSFTSIFSILFTINQIKNLARLLYIYIIMKKIYTQILFLLFIVLGYSQSFDYSQGNLNAQFQAILKEISMLKSKIPLEIDGSTYFYKKPQNSNIIILDGKIPIRIKTNYNILNETFEVESQDGLLNLSPNKIHSINFKDHSFVVFDSKFYELITKNDKFSILKSYSLEANEQDYQPGIQQKPNLIYKKVSRIFIESNNKISEIKASKKAIIAMFGNSNEKKIKSFIKKNKISIRDSKMLKLLFDSFKDILPTN